MMAAGHMRPTAYA